MTARGTVSDRLEAVLVLRLRGPTGTVAEVEAVVDTGYTGSLTLPQTAVTSLGLVRRSSGYATLADGSIRRFDTFAAELEWDGGWRGVVASAVGDEVLVGMSLLTGYELRVEVTAAGVVEVKPLPAARTA